MSVCQVCQHDNPAGAEYCEDCGAALSSPAGTPAGASSAPAPTGGAASSGAPPAGAASGSPSSSTLSSGGSASGPQSDSSGSTAGTGASSASASSPDALGEAAASVGTTLSGAGDVGVESDDVEAASPNANAAPPTGGSPASGAAPAAGAPASGAAASAATAQAGGAPAGAGAPSSSSASAGAGAPTPDSPAASGAQQPRLVAVRYGAPTGQEIPLLGQRLVVGRFDPETGPVDIDLSEAGEAVHISRQHGELFREADGNWMVRDLGSTNGVFVKGRADASFGPRITAPRALANGDEVTFGNARFVFRAD